MEDTIAVFIPITLIVITGFVTKWLSDNRVKRELIKVSATAELSAALLSSSVNNEQSTLKWGIVAIAIGVSLVVIQMAHLNADDPLTFGLVSIFGGLGLLTHYFIWRRLRDN